ncbi:MAG: ADOP family duplicated permease, partial [Gemmatimonadetes bacterium]|nr:ADOP family duplicated permease [Gemmatimonadota bacterium]
LMAQIGETERRSADWSATFVPLREMVVGNVRPALLAIFAAVVLVLLISCANVANLSLARTTQREREIVVRLALGAGRARILRQVLVESVVLATAAGVAGVLIAFLGVQTLVALAPPDIPRLDGVGVDRGVLAFTLTISLLAGLAFGLAPALHAARSTAGGALRQTGKTTQNRQRNRILDGIVVSEIALALVLLVSAGLVMKSFSRLVQVDTGFNQNNLLAIQVSPPASKYPLAEVPGFYERLSAQIGGLPGVRSVGLGSDLPLSGRASVGGGISEARWRAGERETLPALQRKVNADFLAVIQTPLLSGRTFNSGDAEGPQRLIINQTFARQLWGDEDPVGKRLTHTSNPGEDDWREVIGVVGDVLYEGMDREAYATYYQYQSFSPWRTMWIFVRTAGSSRALIEPARTTIHTFDADVPIYDVRTLTQVVGSSVASPRFNMWLFATFAAVALLLAAAGIYGVLSFVVTQRNREIGIRMALGAHKQSVIQLVMRRSLKLIALGCGVGLFGALLSTRLLQHLLFEVSPTDPTTLAAVVTVLVAAALGASYVPARRASLVDPMEVLREE